MAAGKIISGARAKVSIVNPNNGTSRVIGSFSSCSYTVNYDVAPAFVLGSFIAVELDYTAVEPVSVTCNGWNALDHGMHQDLALPLVQELLDHEYLEFGIIDRVKEERGDPDPRIGVIRFVRPTGGTVGYNQRQLSEQTSSYIGILADTQGSQNHETASAARLP